MPAPRILRRIRLALAPTPARMRATRFLRVHAPMFIGAVVLLSTIGALTIVLFLRSSSALERQLRETLRATAAATALSIDGDKLDAIHGPDDMTKREYTELSGRLRGLIIEIPQLRFAYVLRRTDDPDVLEFVVDADSFAPLTELDDNGNGILDSDEEPSYPGEQYDIAEVPALQNEAFLHSTTDPEVTVDQWGELLSGYAPIRSFTTGKIVAVLGIDMDAAEFRSYTRSILSPFAVLMIMALACLLTAGVALLIESRQLQTLSRVSAERSGLLQLTFHQLGEPITIIQWAIETLEDVKSDESELSKILPENLSDMREGVRRLSSIIDTLQEAEKVELSAFSNNPVEQSVKRVLEDAIAIVEPGSAGGTGRITLESAEGTCVFDPHLLTVVLRRLFENALEFSRSGSMVRVRASEEGKWLRIDVSDHGCGIPADDLPRLFEKYRRAANARSMKPDGNGLGLYIARGIVELMGGVIHASSVEGQGTTMTVRIPRHPAKHA